MRLRLLLVLVITSIVLAGAVAGEEEQGVAPDPRLDQKVTYQAKGLVLHKVLAELTEKTGVTMTCGKNDSDWQVRDRKVSIFTKDVPLAEIQDALSDILRFTWARGTSDGEATYRLFQDLKARKEEDRLRAQAEEEDAKKQAERRQAALAEFEKLDSLTPEEIEKLKTESPFLYAMAKAPVGKAMSNMFRSVPDLRAALLEGRDVSMDLAKLSPEAVEAVRGFVTSFDGLMRRFDPSPESFAGLADNIYDARLVIKRPHEGVSDLDRRSVLGVMEIEADGLPDVDMPLFDPKSPTANVMGSALTMLDEGATKEEIQAYVRSIESQAQVDQALYDQPAEPLPDGLDAEKSIKIEISPQAGLPEILEEIAKKADLQIVSDHFAQRPRRPAKVEDKLGALLQSVSALYGKRLQKKGSLLALEDRRWFVKRSWEVPEEWLEHWRERMRKGTLDFEDMVDIACLRDEQLTNTVAVDRVLRAAASSITSNKYVLRLYAVLSDAQKASLTAPGGLDPSTLTAEQWPHFQYLVSKTVGDKLPPDARLALSMEMREDKPGSFRLENFSADPDSGESMVASWTINYPLLPPPPPMPPDRRGKPQPPPEGGEPKASE